jgi:aspartyl-tRNA(Asn)/glutamyl-tRNA(Gln) amidotransferase subunit C
MPETKDGMDVSYVAHLARINLTEEEIVLFQGQLDQVLQYVEQLDELDVSNVEPTAHAIPIYNVLRKDEVGPSLTHANVMANAPAVSNEHISVPKIIDQ